jgi:hypothetical protein
MKSQLLPQGYFLGRACRWKRFISWAGNMMNARFDSPVFQFVQHQQPTKVFSLKNSALVATGCLLALGVGRPAQSFETPALASQNTSVEIAQVYEIAPPPPAGAMVPLAVPGVEVVPQAPASGQQYVVYVDGNSQLLLNQVRLVEPTAFVTTFEGRSVIQAGRFNSSQNAQQRVNQLTAQGIGAQMVGVPAAVPSYAQSPLPPANTYASNGDLPPLPTSSLPASPVVAQTPTTAVPAVPSTTISTPLPPTPQVAPPNVEFGQELTYTVPQGASGSPMSMNPPQLTPTAAPVQQAQTVPNAPFYVVIPTSANNLAEVSSQIIQLGTPPASVQQRTAPRGPHVAVGPFADRGLANSWNNFYRQAGFGSSRVYFDR